MSACLIGCGGTVKLGAGYDLDLHDNNIGTYTNISDDRWIGLAQIETATWKGLSGQYTHISGISGSDRATVDVVTANVTFNILPSGFELKR